MPDNSDMANALMRYPNSNDVNFARQQDWSYGQPYAGPWFGGTKLRMPGGDPNQLMKGQPVTLTDTQLTNSSSPQLSDYYAKAALAANRSALATLGFDPSRTMADISRDPARQAILGVYSHKPDEIYANALDPSSIVHESIHRGIDKLRSSPYWDKNWTNMQYGSLPDELAVRYLMKEKMGDPENYPYDKKQKAQALDYFTGLRQHQISDMEAAAAKFLAKRRPGGPR